MIKLHPGERATVEELKEYPWFGGIDWDEVTYGPTAERKCIRPMVYLMSVLVLISLMTVYTVLANSILPPRP